jgi:hypothetical protein
MITRLEKEKSVMSSPSFYRVFQYVNPSEKKKKDLFKTSRRTVSRMIFLLVILHDLPRITLRIRRSRKMRTFRGLRVGFDGSPRYQRRRSCRWATRARRITKACLWCSPERGDVNRSMEKGSDSNQVVELCECVMR